MATTLWNQTDVTAAGSSWERSWRQELYTDYGQDFRFVAHMEKVTKLGDLPAIHTPTGAITICKTEALNDPEIAPLAANVQTALTALVEALLKKRAAQEAQG